MADNGVGGHKAGLAVDVENPVDAVWASVTAAE